MKRKNIGIIVVAVLFVCTILLYVVQSSNKEVLFNTTNKSSNTNTNKESNSENVANARDGIQGVVQPSPFITTSNGVEANGYFTDEGTKWSFFDYIAKEYGVKSTGVPLNKEAINASLDKGNPIIASVHPGKFTTVGHIILITAKDKDGNYIINDPNSYTRTLKKWSYDELKTEIVAMWEFSK